MRVEIKRLILAAAFTGIAGAAWADDQPAVPTSKCVGPVDPYKNYKCLDTYLGENVFQRLANYYVLEWGHDSAPTDPNAPSSHREGWPTTPQTTPPMPFTEWPYGGATTIGVTRPASVDSPLMVALANTGTGKFLQDNNIQIYGWFNGGGNVSTNSTKPGGNAPIAYTSTPDKFQFDQAVLYVERLPDTVQTDHIDWGMRLSAIYGQNYRYTQSYAPWTSYQFLSDNKTVGYDFPMMYGEVYVPKIAEGLVIRAGRYIAIPDIEAQLAPNNYMYTHSLTYALDNYTNEGIFGTLAVTKNLMVQLGVNIGTESWIGHWGQNVHNPDPNPLYPGSTFKKDPGATPSLSACVRYTWNDGKDTVYPCMNGINAGNWGYNNLQWYGFTYYHKFDDHWHVAYEFYDLRQDKVANARNATVQAAVAAGGTPFSPQYMPYNAPNMAQCNNAGALTCTAQAIGTVAYINYSPDTMNNFSLRPEFYNDMQGQRTGTKARYVEVSLGWQHWFSPQVETRPEIGWYRSIGAKAFNGNSNAGVAPNKNYTVIGAADLIVHF